VTDSRLQWEGHGLAAVGSDLPGGGRKRDSGHVLQKSERHTSRTATSSAMAAPRSMRSFLGSAKRAKVSLWLRAALTRDGRG
jgi:hypothetical protein